MFEELVSKNKYLFPLPAKEGTVFFDEETVVIIAQSNGKAYYHSMIEDLPRLVPVLEFLRSNPEIKILAFPWLAQNSNFLGRMLQLNNSWVELDPNTIYRFEKLIVPPATTCGNANYEYTSKLQEQFHKQAHVLPSAHNNTRPKILLHKREIRGLTNHDDLLKALHAKFANEYEINVFMGDEDMATTAAMHHAASVVVSPHGAGLSHLIFMRRGTGLVEIHPLLESPRKCHQLTAEAVGVDSLFLLMTADYKWGDNFLVEDIPTVINAVSELLDQQNKKKRILTRKKIDQSRVTDLMMMKEGMMVRRSGT